MERRGFLKNLGLLGASALGSAANLEAQSPADPQKLNFKTKHLIWIINGNGCRKKEFYESPDISPNITRLAREGFVYEEDHNETITNHGSSFTEMLTGNPVQSGIPIFPTIPHYIRKTNGDEATKYWYLNGVSYFRQWRFSVKYFTVHADYGEPTRPMMMSANNIFFEDNKKDARTIVAEQFPDMGLTAKEKAQLADFIGDLMATKKFLPTINKPIIPRAPFNFEAIGLEMVPHIMREFKPRLLIFQQTGHDTGHGNGGYLRDETGYFEYRKVAEATDAGVGKIIDFIKSDPYFSQNTTIVVRPEFGRDDEINVYGDIHHSEGYYQAHRSASVWWGPDIKQGKSTVLVNRMDIATTLCAMFGAKAVHGTGLLRPHLFKEHVGKLPEYVSYTPV